ncbi:MAG TPA: hypothetical protein VGP89_09425 [Candidatus Angelobacter sp.]|nr:hypothetical protein [Candidatus Angelobacter sp.]
MQLKVVFENPKNAPVPIFSNHVGISQAGTEVQFEFVFLDINHMAQMFEGVKSAFKPSAAPTGGPAGPVEIEGKTVAKIVMPMHVFIQLKPHLIQMFSKIEQELKTAVEEKQ